jgi:hypothetical protein
VVGRLVFFGSWNFVRSAKQRIYLDSILHLHQMATVSLAPLPRVSLKQLMDEELARKLQDEETTIDLPSEPELSQEDEDLLLALKLSEQESNVNTTVNTTTVQVRR